MDKICLGVLSLVLAGSPLLAQSSARRPVPVARASTFASERRELTPVAAPHAAPPTVLPQLAGPTPAPAFAPTNGFQQTYAAIAPYSLVVTPMDYPAAGVPRPMTRLPSVGDYYGHAVHYPDAPVLLPSNTLPHPANNVPQLQPIGRTGGRPAGTLEVMMVRDPAPAPAPAHRVGPR